jgi:hypothetical protein
MVSPVNRTATSRSSPPRPSTNLSPSPTTTTYTQYPAINGYPGSPTANTKTGPCDLPYTAPAPTPNPLPHPSIVDLLPDLAPVGAPYHSDSDGSSLSDASVASLLQPIADIPEHPPLTPDQVRRPSNPSRLNAAWQTLFRDALHPTDDVHDRRPPRTPPELPPPIYPAPNEPVGHDFSAKSPGIFRLWDGNLNGLSAKDNYASLQDLCATLKTRHVDAIAIQEPNLDFLQAPIRDKITKICKSHFEFARIVTPSTTCLRAPSVWKPGGSLLIVVGKWAHAIIRQASDNLGRWTSVTLNGRGSSAVTIYSAYNIVKTAIRDAGPSTVYAQQWQLLRLSGVTSPDPRQRFIADL